METIGPELAPEIGPEIFHRFMHALFDHTKVLGCRREIGMP
jgi:hypothetical protein